MWDHHTEVTGEWNVAYEEPESVAVTFQENYLTFLSFLICKVNTTWFIGKQASLPEIQVIETSLPSV